MSDTCIVCLGDLSTGIDGSAAPSTFLARSPVLDAPNDDHNLKEEHEGQEEARESAADAANTTTQELVAHLLPCGHYLHDECLKPWVERANSCPICRANFHQVELMPYVNGQVISSYAVEDKTQVADLDPSIFLEVPEDDPDAACQVCGEGDNEDILIFCDGCDKLWHTYCVDLEEVPYNSWFCENCSSQRQYRPNARNSRHGTATVGRRRTRAMERRRRLDVLHQDEGWNQVWAHVHSQLNLDLDDPYEDDVSSATAMRRYRATIEASRREHEAWERRRRVAALAGAEQNFRHRLPLSLNDDGNQLRDPAPLPAETREEISAWDAFNAASAEPEQPETSRRNKRKSRTSSPALSRQGPSSPRDVKRRRTSTPPVADRELSTGPRPQPHLRTGIATRSLARRQPLSPRPRSNITSNTPSLLSSLLQEIEASAPAGISGTRTVPRRTPASEQFSPRPSSPVTSNHSSPRALSASPPPDTFRPGSPGLTSSIQPVFPHSPPSFSPARSISPEPAQKPPDSSNTLRTNTTQTRFTTMIAAPRPFRPRVPNSAPGPSSRPRSHEASPNRIPLSNSAKEDVQKLVKAALKPHYHDQKISKDEYTVINRDVSRMLYDKIGDFEALDLNGRARWERIAGEEVNKAVTALRT